MLIDPVDGLAEHSIEVEEHYEKNKKAYMTVFAISGAILLGVIISLYRIDGEYLKCEPYYLRNEITKENEAKEKDKKLS